MPDLRLLYFGQVIMVIDCRCFHHRCMAYVTCKSDFQNKDRFENLSCNQCYPYSTIGNIVLAFAKVSYIHAGHLHNANCDCCNLGNIWNFPQVQEKYVESIWFCPVGFDPSADCDYPYFRLFFATSPVRFYI